MSVPPDPAARPTSNSSWFLQDGGDAGAAARAVDWGRTPLGPPGQWPTALKITLAMMFHARQPMFLWWGQELVQFYNDHYIPHFKGSKHPTAMGQRGRECWPEVWSIIAPQIESVMERGEAVTREDSPVPVLRNGRLEEGFWTYSYTPVFGDGGGVAGTLVTCTETTKRIRGERRASRLRRVQAATDAATTRKDLLKRMTAALEESKDVPSVLIAEPRTIGSANKPFRLLAAHGMQPHENYAVLDALHSAAQQPGADPLTVTLPAARDASIDDSGPIARVYVATKALGRQPRKQCVAFSLHPELPWDSRYRGFLDQIAAHYYSASDRVDESALRAVTDEERRILLERAPVATALMTGPEHVFELANPRFCELVGREREAMVGLSCEQALPELRDSTPLRMLTRAYETGKTLSVEEVKTQLDRGKGLEDCYFNFTLQPLQLPGGKSYGLMAIAVEITEAVKARHVLEQSFQEREQLLEDLRQASRAKDEFLAMLGHELRNPLSPIVTALSLMEGHQADGIREPLSVIARQTEHLTRLVDDLLDVAKITQGKIELRQENVDLAEVLATATDNASALLESRSHHLELQCPRATYFCYGDPVRLGQVFSNLLTNAARYTEPHGHIRVVVEQVGDAIRVEVHDNGKGISETMLPRVFNLFEQGQQTYDRAEGGLGLGLALVKSLTQLHDGSVTVRSAGIGYGSTFVVTLPALTPRAGEDVTVQFQQPATGQPTHEQRRVLVVDDNVDAGSLLAMVLKKAGHTTALSAEPMQALDLAAEFKPEVAVLDIGLPVIDGYELARRLKKVPGCEDCMLVAVTGYGQTSDRERSNAAGFAHHLVKPVKTKALLSLLEHAAPDREA